MLYKTIVLELIQDSYPKLHRRLCLGRTLLRELDRYASELRTAHQQWIERGMDPTAARELAVAELQERLTQETNRLEA